jgi:hypothetical protein
LAPGVLAGTAQRSPFAVASTLGYSSLGGPAAVGNGTDYAASVTGTISKTTGSFNDVSSGITETGQVNDTGSQIANTFTLQINSQFFSLSPACAAAANPATCQAWEQFVYETDGNAVYMQYWLINYGATCPSGWWSYGSDCYTNSPASTYSGSALTAADLANVTFAGSAQSGGNDEVSLSVGSGAATMVSNPDSKVYLAGSWNVSEFNVFGDGGGGQANFSAGSTLEAKVAVHATDSQAPTCIEEGFTGETNNLSLTGTSALGPQTSPTIAFAQTNGATTPQGCATAAGTLTATATALSVAPSSPATNQPATLTATVTPGSATPLGTVEFDNNGVAIPGCATQAVVLVASSYRATCQTSFTAASAPESLSAAYTPSSSSLAPSASSVDDLAIARDATATALRVSTPAPVVGQSLTYTATVTPSDSGPAVPSGSVEFLAGGSPIGSCSSRPLSSGTASCTVSYASSGTRSITATYLGDVNFANSTSSAHVLSVAPSQAQVKAALAAVLVPSGKAAKIKAILQAGGYPYRFSAPSSGALVLDWYGKGAGGKKTLVAVTSRAVPSTGKASEKLKLTSQGRKLLKKARKVKITSNAVFTPTGTTGTTATQGFTLRR